MPRFNLRDEKENDKDLPERLRSSLSDTKVNLRLPSELKDELVLAAKKKNIPYQRYIKNILIESVLNNRSFKS